MKPAKEQPIRLSARSTATQIKSLPIGMYQANRYDTDNTHVIHLWNDEGKSFDVVIPKGKKL